MDVVGKKVESQVQFWSLLGPAFVLLSISVLLFKVSVHWYFPVSALIGIPLCVKWKMKGMAVALGCLLCLSGISFQNLDLDDRYWHVGLALTMAFSFIVLTLSLEEAQILIQKLQLESQSRLDNFSLLDEKWKTAEQEWQIEQEKARTDVTTLTQEVTRIQEDKQTFYKLAQLAKDELVQVRNQHEKLLQDILYKKQQIAQLNERLEETEITIQGFVDTDAEKQILLLTHRVTSLESEKETLKVKVTSAQTEELVWQQERARFMQELQICQEREQHCLSEQRQLQQAEQERQNTMQTLQNKCLILEHEKNTLIQSQIGLQHQFEQIRHLETQHRQTLQQFQRKVQDLELKLTAEEQQKESIQLQQKELEEQVSLQEKQFKQRDEHYKNSLKQFNDQVHEQKTKIETEFRFNQQQTLQHYQQEKEALEQKLKVTQEHYQKAQDEKNAQAAQAQQKIEELSEELSRQQGFIQVTIQQMQKLEELKLQMERDLQETQQQLGLTKQTAKFTQHEPIKLLHASSGNTRRVEGMYLQLKEQFQEKCRVLDATRRELFYANEELLKWQKEDAEKQIFGQSLNETLLQRDLLEWGNDLDTMQHAYQQEIDEMHELVQYLFQQLSKK